ncbi:amidohydrolase [Paenalcaligenes sp. Me52]|uniref:amidohydrolase n=1 Tax=Paenalcaligenes sp. Me52 TaxID=3392038 RepID=UPI003D284177
MRLSNAARLATGSVCVAWALMGSSSVYANETITDVGPRIDQVISQNYSQWDAIYKDLHQHPELGFQETRTAKVMAEQMKALGFEVTEGVGGTGVVAIFRNGDGPVVMVRTELDALPVQENTGLPYSSNAVSTFNGAETAVMHACGHDIHMATWLGTAKTLVSLKDSWQGTLMFIAQPAEESLSGAKAMIDDGLFKRFTKPDVAIALHTWNDAAGLIGLTEGPVLTGSTQVEIVFHGVGAHGSMPHTGIDPIVQAAQFITTVQSVISRAKNPGDFGVFTVGAVHSGQAGNVIPNQATLMASMRFTNDETRKVIHDGVVRTAKGVAQISGAEEPEIKFAGDVPPTINDKALVDQTEQILQQALPAETVVRIPMAAPSEDFALYGKEGIPSLFFFLGALDPKLVEASRLPGGKPVPTQHSPFFAPVPEPTITTGVKAMTLTVLGQLAK